MDLSSWLNLADHVLGTVNQATNGSLVNTVNNVVSGVQQIGNTLTQTINGINYMVSSPIPTQPTYTPPQQTAPNYSSIANYNPNQISLSNLSNLLTQQQTIPQTYTPIGASATTIGGATTYNPATTSIPFNPNNSSIPNTPFLNTLTGLLGNLGTMDFGSVFNNVNSSISSGVNSLFNSLLAPINSLSQVANNIASNLYQSTSGVLNNFGVNFGSFSSTIDGLVRGLIDKLGLSYDTQAQLHTQALNSLSDSYNSSINHIEGLVADFLDNSKLFLSKLTENTDTNIGLHAKIVIDEFRNQLPDFLKPIYDFIKGLMHEFIKYAQPIIDNLVSLFSETLSNLDTQIKRLKKGEFKTLDEFITNITGSLPQEHIFHLILTFLAFVPIVGYVTKLSAEPVIDQLNEISNSQFRTTNLDISTLVSAYVKQIIKEGKLNDELARKGISNEDIDILTRDALPLLPIDIVRQLYLRGEVSTEHVDYEFSKQGYNDYQTTLIRKLFHQLPPYQDIVRLADKHLFDDSFHAEFGQFTEYPQKFIEFMAQLGYDEYWSKSLWGAHWSLPGLNTAFDMLHRGLINTDQMNGYLQMTDIMPFFRDKLIDLTYEPFTRVDVRRMYQVGTLSYDEMIKAYKDIGYSQEKAEKLADFTRKSINRTDENGEDKLTKRVVTAIENSYAKGKIDRQTATDKLVQLGVDNAHAATLLAVIDVERGLVEHTDKIKDNITRTIRLTSTSFVNGTVSENEAIEIFKGLGYSQNEALYEVNYLKLERMVSKRNKLLEHAKTSYINHTIDNVELAGILNEAGLNSSEQAIFITDVTLERGLKNKKLDEKSLEKLVILGVITPSQFRDELLGHGYPAKYVNWIIEKVRIESGS